MMNVRSAAALVMALSITAAADAPPAIWGRGEVPTLTSEKAVPQNLAALWADYDEHYDEHTPLDVEVVKAWEQDGIIVQLVRFTVGTFHGQKTILGGYYAYPKGGENLPGLLQINGGGQKGSAGGPVGWAKRGYACFNPNNGAQEWDGKLKGLPNTEWGALQGVKGEKSEVPGLLAPMTFTIDQVMSPRNYNRLPRTLASRRAISFLQSRPEVDSEKIGVRGHSTGGVQTVLISVDPRVKAAVPSVGGAGQWFVNYDHVVGTQRRKAGMSGAQFELFMRASSEDAHWKAMHAPVLFLGAANDFNSPLINVVKALDSAPVTEKRHVTGANYNHQFPPEVGVADLLWFEDHLKGSFAFPPTPVGKWELEAEDGAPRFRVSPGESELPIKRVEIYYSYGRHPMLRFWVTAEQRREGDAWIARCPLFYDDEPLFAFGNVIYELPKEGIPLPEGVSEFAVTSDVGYARPEDLQAAGAKPTAKPLRLIEDFSRGLQDWQGRVIPGNRGWVIETRKLADPRWMGPTGAELVLEVRSPKAGAQIGFQVSRAFRGQNNGAWHYYAFATLPEKGWNTVRLKPSDFTNIYGEELDDWHKVIVFKVGAARTLAYDKKRFLPRAGDKMVTGTLPTEVSGWDNAYYENTTDAYAKDNVEVKRGHPRALLRDIRWEGGEYVSRPKFHEED